MIYDLRNLPYGPGQQFFHLDRHGDYHAVVTELPMALQPERRCARLADYQGELEMLIVPSPETPKLELPRPAARGQFPNRIG